MSVFDRSFNAATLTACIFLAALAEPAWAHSGGSTSHSTSPGVHFTPAHMTGPSTTHTSPMTMTPNAKKQGAAANETSAAAESEILPPPNPSFAASCEGETGAHCEATLQSQFDASGGDPNPIWSTPVPTVVPPTPAAPAITEPLVQTGPVVEQSGGSSPPLTQGGGPTLADCMSLWEPAVHMTKALWKSTCIRTMNGIDMPDDGLGLGKIGSSKAGG